MSIRLWSALALGFLFALLTAASSAQAQFCRSSSASPSGWEPAASGTPGCPALLPPPGGSPTGVLAANDDGSSPTIALTTAFPGGLNFFGGPSTTSSSTTTAT